MSKKKYPYQNLSLKSMPGERWKDIPKLEGYFKVSNFGRIKRMAYETIYRNGALYPECEMIIKPYIRWQINNYMQDYTRFIVNRVALDGVRYNYTLARLVYCLFVKKFDLRDPRFVIFYKDDDSYNIQPSNLYLATISEKQKRIKVLRRSPSPLAKLTPEQRRQRQLAIAKAVSKPVTQYNLQGKRIKTFSSAKEANRKLGLNECCIGAVARGRLITSGGFIWRFGNQPEIDVRAAIKNRKIKHSPAVDQLMAHTAKAKLKISKPVTKGLNVKVNTEKAYSVHTKHQQWKKAKTKTKKA